MNGLLIVEFEDPRAMVSAAQAAPLRNCRLLDAYSPFPVEDVAALLELRQSRVRAIMFLGGLCVAALAYGGEYYTEVIGYAYNSGGRPFNSWPAFMLVPFAVGILGATIAGFIAFLAETGLPCLHHPLFFDRSFCARKPGRISAGVGEARRRARDP